MKWGVRKDGKPQGYKGTGRKRTSKSTVLTRASKGLSAIKSNASKARSESKASAKVSKDRRDAVKSRNLKIMSPEELKARTERLNAEKKLKDLTFEMEATSSEKRQKAVKSTLSSAGSKAAKVATTAIVGAATVTALSYVGRYIQDAAIYKAYMEKGAPSDVKKWAAESAKIIGKDPSVIEDVVSKQGRVVFSDPMRRAAILEDASSFVKAAYKKGK